MRHFENVVWSDKVRVPRFAHITLYPSVQYTAQQHCHLCGHEFNFLINETVNNLINYFATHLRSTFYKGGKNNLLWKFPSELQNNSSF
jgi:hypothetical protein